jgi:hypothetical protein
LGDEPDVPLARLDDVGVARRGPRERHGAGTDERRQPGRVGDAPRRRSRIGGREEGEIGAGGPQPSTTTSTTSSTTSSTTTTPPECVAPETFNYALGQTSYLGGRFTINPDPYFVPEHVFPEAFDFVSTQPVAWITVQGHLVDSLKRYDYAYPGVTSGTNIAPKPDPDDGFRRVKIVSVCFYP